MHIYASNQRPPHNPPECLQDLVFIFREHCMDCVVRPTEAAPQIFNMLDKFLDRQTIITKMIKEAAQLVTEAVMQGRPLFITGHHRGNPDAQMVDVEKMVLNAIHLALMQAMLKAAGQDAISPIESPSDT